MRTAKAASVLFVAFILAGCSDGGVPGSGVSKTEARQVSPFTAIEAGGVTRVQVEISTSTSVEVEADDNIVGLITTKVEGGALKIDYPKISPKVGPTLRIKMPKLEELEIAGAGSAEVSGLKNDSLKVEAQGAVTVKLSGQTAQLEATIEGASHLEAKELTARKADVDVSGASSATVTATETLDAEASGASSVDYYGSPKQLTKKPSGTSSITAR